MPRYIVRGQRVKTSELERARELRKEMTRAERVLWSVLRRNQLRGLQFRRQQIIGGYIADFYCHSIGLAIEVDGFAPDGEEAVKADAARSHFLRSQRVATLRVPARAILENLEGAVARIAQVCSERRARSYPERGGDPPQVGEGHGQ